MRAALAFLLVLAGGSLAARAEEAPPPDPDGFDTTEAFLGADRPTGPWRLDDGLGVEQVPWDDFDPSLGYFPRGDVHLGLEGRLSGLFMDSLQTDMRPQLEVHGFVHIRYASRSPWHLRLGLVVGWEPHQTTYLGGGTLVTTSAVYVRARLLALAFDLGSNAALRVGPDLGIQIAPSPDGARVLFSGAGLAHLAFHTDDGRFEAGVHGGFQLTGVARVERPNTGFPFSDSSGVTYVPDPVLGVTAGYLF
ncbi:MAG: hypothetical protein KF729_16725 [Sandaracinaceae bacterium]|nr:hypothetical protein [Sandaracinaceae bacterium]